MILIFLIFNSIELGMTVSHPNNADPGTVSEMPSSTDHQTNVYNTSLSSEPDTVTQNVSRGNFSGNMVHGF